MQAYNYWQDQPGNYFVGPDRGALAPAAEAPLLKSAGSSVPPGRKRRSRQRF